MSIVVPESILKAGESPAQRRELSVSTFVEQSLLVEAMGGLSDLYLDSSTVATGRDTSSQCKCMACLGG
jgi:hypothetical protein